MEYTGNCLKLLSFWAINGELKLSVLKGQLEEMKAMGLRGTVFHPRYYPGRPAYMRGAYLDILSEIILYAGQLEMEFWIYDETDGPPEVRTAMCWSISRTAGVSGSITVTEKWCWKGKPGLIRSGEMKWHISSSILMMDTGKDCRKRPLPVLPDFQ